MAMSSSGDRRRVRYASGQLSANHRDPGSVSVVRYTQLRPFVLHVNHTGARLAPALQAAASAQGASPEPNAAVPPGDAVIGGSTD